MRLLPGTRVDVHVITREGRQLVRSRVVRAYVSSLTADSVTYRGAFAFDHLVDVRSSGYAIPEGAIAEAVLPGTTYPDQAA